MSWFKREKAGPEIPEKPPEGGRRVRTEGLWLKCEGCRQIIWKKDLEANWNVCPKCGRHMRMDAFQRLKLLLDGPWEEFDADLHSSNPLDFVDSKPYSERLEAMRQSTNLFDALISAGGTLAGRPVLICAMDIRFMGGSMGCGRRKDHPRYRARHRSESPFDHRLGLRRRTYAGRRCQPDAVGQNFRRPDAPRRVPRPLYQRAHRPHHRRRHGQLRHAGRFEYRRTRSTHRLRRAAGHRANHPPETAGRVPTRRVPGKARHVGRRGAAQRTEDLYRPGPALPGRLIRLRPAC